MLALASAIMGLIVQCLAVVFLGIGLWNFKKSREAHEATLERLQNLAEMVAKYEFLVDKDGDIVIRCVKCQYCRGWILSKAGPAPAGVFAEFVAKHRCEDHPPEAKEPRGPELLS
jgi:uncharacterized membrane protein YbaN (DUF454 family)